MVWSSRGVNPSVDPAPSAAALLARKPMPDESEVRVALDQNLCRCGSHNRIVRAVLRAANAGDQA